MKNYNCFIICFIVVLCTFFLGIGYAQLSEIELSITGDAIALGQTGILISDIEYQENINADPQSSKIITYYQTLLSTKNVLGNTLDSSITYQIKFKNLSNSDKFYDQILYDSSFYDNEDIKVELNGINKGDVVHPNEEITGTVTFKYKEGLTTITNNELNSYINFKFIDTLGNHTITYDNSIPTTGYNYPIAVQDHGSLSFYLQGTKPTKIFVNNNLWTGYNMNTGRLVLDDITEDITISANYTPVNTAIFGDRNTIYNAMTNLAGGGSNITAIKFSDSVPSGATTREVQASSSPEKIYMWYDNGIIYWNSNNWNPQLRGSMSQLFNGFSNLNDISGLETWDTSEVTAIWEMFKGCSSLTSAESLKYWDVHNVTNMLGVFNGCFALNSIKGFDNWDVSSVTNMKSLFVSNRSLADISPISNWNVSNVHEFSGMFQACNSLSDISALAYWNTQSATEMIQLFQAAPITDLSPLASWNVANVTDMRQIFFQCRQVESLAPLMNWQTSSLASLNQAFAQMSNLTSTTGLDNWDVSHVTNYNSLLDGCSKVTSLSGLTNWNVSSGTTFVAAFYGLSRLTQEGADSINGWQLSNTANFNNMFKNTGKRPTFTFIVDGNSVQGQYDGNGTLYIPS